MIAGLFNSLAGVFKGFFSRAFWFASFMPVALAFSLHMIVAALTFPTVVKATRWLHAPTTDNLAIFPIAAATVVVLAYAMGPLAPVALGLLDGSAMPVWLQDRMRAGRARTASSLQRAIRTCGAYDRIGKIAQNRLIEARTAGNQVQGAPQIALITTARARVAEIARRMSADDRPTRAEWRTAWRNLGRPRAPGGGLAALRPLFRRVSENNLPTQEEMEAAIAAVDAALRANNADLPRGHAQHAESEKLSEAQSTLLDEIERGRQEAQYRLERERVRFGSRRTTAPPMPTRIAEARRATETYSNNVYGVDFYFIWPRLWLVMNDKDNGLVTVTDAQTQLDFSVMSVCLIATVPIVWGPILAATATSPWLFLAVISGGVLACAFFYELAVASQWRLAQVVKAALDRYRLDLLTTVLLQPKPATRAAERRLWEALQADEAHSGPSAIAYRYPAS